MLWMANAVDGEGQVVIRRKLHRDELLTFFEKQGACTVAMEACGAAHHWGRALTDLGHTVRLIAPEAVRPFVKRGKKNDAADAAAICEAASRPGVTFVPIKSLEQRGTLAVHAARSLLVKQQTMLANAMRGLAAEFGLTVPKSMGKLGDLMTLVGVDEAMPEEARQVLGALFGQCRALEESIGALEAKIVAHARRDDAARRLATVPGIGRITKAGNREIRRLLVLGATSMVHRAAGWNSAAGAWTRGVLQRRPVRLVTVALANKMARIAWALMTRKEVYHAKGRPAAAAPAPAAA